MQDFGLFVSLPLWLIFMLTLLLALVSVELGYQWARRKQRDAVEKESPVGAMVGAMLGLLAFLLAFMFGMTVERFQDRKMALLEEVNAIGTAYLRADTIPEPQRSEVRLLLRSYTDERLQWAGVEPVDPALSATDLLDRLWQQTAAVAQNSSDVVALFVESINAVIDVNTERKLVRERSHIPGPLWDTLYLLALLALTAMGYHCGVSGTARSPVMVMVALGFSVVIMLIADIDRPGEGAMSAPQDAMIELRSWMDRPVR